MKDKVLSVLTILFGIFIIVFPILGIIKPGYILGFSVLILSIFLLVNGSANIEYQKLKSASYILLGMATLVLAISMIFNPLLIEFLEELIIYIGGLLLIIIGIIIIVTSRDDNKSFWTGIVGVLIGALYIVLGTFVKSSIILGILIGLWLIFAGTLSLLNS